MKKKLPLIFLIVILLLAAYLRLYRISDYMTFLGDEGRDVIVAKNILSGHFTLLGPRSSAGDFFMGPAYYYMITPFLLLSNYDPVGPAVMVALFGIATVWLVYYVGRKWFDTRAGLLAAALYAVSPVVITYSHSSWNPDVLPFVSLLLMYLLYLAVTTKKSWKYFILVGFLLGIGLQLHYLAIFLGVITVVYIFWASWYKNKTIKIGLIAKNYLQVLAGFFIGFSPFLLFEMRHGFANTKSIFSFIFSDTLQKGYASHTSYFGIVSDVFFRIFARLVFYYPSPEFFSDFSKIALQLFAGASLIVALAALFFLFRVKNKYVLVLISLWLFLSIALLGLYKKSIYDYLFTFIFPLPFFIIGNFLSQLFNFGKNKKQRMIFSGISVLLFASIFLYAFSGRPFVKPANKQKEQTKTIAEAVIKMAGNKPYNFALLSKGNSDHAYRYYLDVLGHPPMQIENPILDPKRTSVTGQLLIVCEDVTCQPLGHPLFDVAGFGRASIAAEKDVTVVKVYRLAPYVENK